MDKKNNGNTNEDDSLITPAERAMLDETFQNDGSFEDDVRLKEAQLDDTDEDGELLNEHSENRSGSDLDIPGAGDDDADEATGEEDEENNGYSEADTE